LIAVKDQSKLSRPAVTVIGGGHPQLCLIEAFKQLDCHIAVIDNRNKVPGRRLADTIVEIDRYDLQAILEYTRANAPNYVASGGSDKTVYVAARIAEEFGLPTYVSSEVATLPMQKAVCQKLLAAAGVPCPFTVYGTSIHTFEQLDWAGIRFPVVVKPDRGIGQTGVDRAEDPDQALTSIATAFAVTENGAVVVQELVEGNEIGINGIVLGGTFYLLTTSYRRSSRRRGGAFGVAMEKVFPAVTAPAQLRHLSEIVQRACT
jgi:glutathione synthase/RimK-type ligase-like ATP-grasp enzyme